MLSKNKIKAILALQRKKNRRESALFLLEGDKMSREAIEQCPDQVEEVFALEAWLEEHQDLLAYPKWKIHKISERDLAKISSLKTPNQVLLLMRQASAPSVPPQLDQQLTLYLDTIQDPGNMGTILRIADWFGLNTVICSPNCVDVYSPKVVQASMGAIFRVVTLTESLVTLVDRYPDLPIYGTLLEGENIYKSKLERRGIVVIGNEGKGISPENKALITKPISIPKGTDSEADSLNAAIATGIVCAFFAQNDS